MRANANDHNARIPRKRERPAFRSVAGLALSWPSMSMERGALAASFVRNMTMTDKRSIDGMPQALTEVRTRPLFVMRLDVRKLQIVGETPGVYRRVGVVPGGVFNGERLSGEVLDGGSDWQSVRHDGSTTLDVRLVLKTSDSVLIGMRYQGIRHGPEEVIARLESGEVVDPESYYFRISPVFEAPTDATTG